MQGIGKVLAYAGVGLRRRTLAVHGPAVLTLDKHENLNRNTVNRIT